MEKLIKNHWYREAGEPFATARILSHKVHPEGLDVERIRFFEAGKIVPKKSVGHIISMVRGSGQLHLGGTNGKQLRIEPGVHIYLPADLGGSLNAEAGAEILHVASTSPVQARGQQLLVRDEMFLAACASETQSLRWIITPQYLSRRIFLHHDLTLLSKSENPVSWFRTTMFDVGGLPKNDDGESVFKMSYNSRTEFNVCYDVKGTARVRMALHPYKAMKQAWSPWFPLDGDTTYHLNESAGGPEEECYIDETTQSRQFLRNRHEVYILGGHVSLFCMFDPASAGNERHRPGEYSDYEPLSQLLGTKQHEAYMEQLTKYDEMVDCLSLAKASGTLSTLEGTPIWKLYLKGRESQVAIETELIKSLIAEGHGRERILADWIQR